MKETPILFKPEMIRAIIEGRKTQTRRLIKPQPKDDGRQINVFCPGGLLMDGVEYQNISCPYGRNGDLLWVKEALIECSIGSDYAHVSGYASLFPNDKDKKDLRFYPDAAVRDNGKLVDWWDVVKRKRTDIRPRHTLSPLFMPKKFARLWLELTADPIPQRLQEITEEDCIAEGAQFVDFGKDKYGNQRPGWRMDKKPETANDSLGTSRFAFGHYIEKINGPGTWEKNPFCWKLKFKRVEK